MPDVTRTGRRAALDALARRFYIDPDEIRGQYERGGVVGTNSGEEDIAPFLAGEEEVGDWAAVTRHGDIFYVLPGYWSSQDACGRAVEHVSDDIFEEVPVCVVSLFDDTEFVPDFASVPWVKGRALLGNGDGGNQAGGE